WEIWGALRYGGRLIIPTHRTTQSPKDFYFLICKEDVTVLNMTPSAFKPLVQLQSEIELCDQLRYVIFGGESLDTMIMAPWFSIRSENSPQIINMYGITESTVHVTYYMMKARDCGNIVGQIGVRIPDLTIYVLDSQGSPAPVG
ncbi:hypothetical protein BGZ80_008826, partial [Entomortierella chlamydospora]